MPSQKDVLQIRIAKFTFSQFHSRSLTRVPVYRWENELDVPENDDEFRANLELTPQERVRTMAAGQPLCMPARNCSGCPSRQDILQSCIEDADAAALMMPFGSACRMLERNSIVLHAHGIPGTSLLHKHKLHVGPHTGNARPVFWPG